MDIIREEPQNGYDSNYCTVTIKTIDGSTMLGRINISPNLRVSEMFTHQMEDPFVVVTEAGFGQVNGKTLFINKSHIIWVEPED